MPGSEHFVQENHRYIMNDTQIQTAICAVMPGWSFTKLPSGFGWAPDRHFRAQLASDNQSINVVIRQCWEFEGFQRECYLYRSVLPFLSIRTPRFYTAFEMEHDSSCWMVLDDLGDRTTDSSDSTDRMAFLVALGKLHGETLHGCFAGDEQIMISTTALNEPPYTDWRHTLNEALNDPRAGIEPWMPNLYQQSLEHLMQEPRVMLHGDTDWSNAVRIPSGVALIDWERAQLGPIGLDLGRLAGAMESSDEVEAFHAAFCQASRQALSFETVRRWIMLGECIDCVRWVSYFIAASIAKRDPGKEWKDRYFHPALDRLWQLRDSLR